MNWMHIISPAASRHALREYLDTLPSTRVLGYGPDGQLAEHHYGHSVIARDNIVRDLEEMVSAGDFGERHAIEIGYRLLCGNAEELFLSRRSRP
jgi:hypothetical protein